MGRRGQSREVWWGAAVLAASFAIGAPAAGGPVAPAHGHVTTVHAQATPSPTPVYPDFTPEPDAPPNLEEGEREVPSVTTRTDHLDLAIMDKLRGEIDADALVAAVGNLDMGARRVLVAVDRQPAGSPHARSLAGSMLFMVHPEILRDDWIGLEDGETRVGDDWMIITVILPETPGEAPADVFFQEGTNVDLDGSVDEVTEAIGTAGAAQLDAGDYTGGIEQMIATAVDHTEVRLNPLPWLLWIGAGLLVLGLLVWSVRGLVRRTAGGRRYRRTIAQGGDVTELLGERSRPDFRRLHRIAERPESILPPLPGPKCVTRRSRDIPFHATPQEGAVRKELARQRWALPEVVEKAEHTGAAGRPALPRRPNSGSTSASW